MILDSGECLHHVRLFGLISKHRRRETLVVAEIETSPVLHQQAHQVRMTLLHREMQRAVSGEIIGSVCVGSALEEELGAITVSAGGAKHERCASLPGPRVDARLLCQQNLNGRWVPTDLDSRVQGGHADMISNDFIFVELGHLVAGGTLEIGPIALLFVRREFETERALHECGIGVVRDGVIDLRSTIDQKLTNFREASTCRDSERWEHTNMEVAIVFPLDVSPNGADIIIVNRSSKRLRFPTKSRALAANSHRLQVFKFRNWPFLPAAITTIQLSAAAAMMSSNDHAEDEATAFA